MKNSVFWVLWRHRYKKYSYLTFSYVHFIKTYFYYKAKALFTRKQQVAILLAEQFGDIVACEPVARYVRKLYPHAHITWVVRSPFKALVAHHPSINQVHTEYSVLESILLVEHRAFDLIFNLHISNRFAEYTRRPLVNKLANSLNINVFTYYRHGCLLEVFSEIANLPRLNENPRVFIPISVKQYVAALQLPPQYVVIHTQSNQTSRNWTSQKWETLAEKILASTAYHIVEVGVENTLSITHPRYLSYCGKLDLLQTAGVIQGATFFVGIDSGPAHLAHATGVYGFILLGKLADFTSYTPYAGDYGSGKNATLIRAAYGEPCASISVETAWEAIVKKF